ncbi:MAG: tRNA glutamyl-Q(34) synthetase GluQRS [Wenzhouxiangella sp.]
MSVAKPFDKLRLGRFAPSPTGELHFGSLVAAVGSYLQARSSSGVWIIRIEDLDPPREKPGAALSQLASLKQFGLISDRPVEYQSALRARHDAALRRLLDAGLAFPCACSRSQLPADGVYPGTCRIGLRPGQSARAVRFQVPELEIEFVDLRRGVQQQFPARQCGDFIIRRADDLIAYQLAVVVDDAHAGVTEVVRGVDLIDSTARQILLQRALDLPQPSYLHLPLIVDAGGRKLSKSSGDDPINRYQPTTALRLALRALGHEPPVGQASLEAQWKWARSAWQIERIPLGPIAIDVQAAGCEVYTRSIDAADSL